MLCLGTDNSNGVRDAESRFFSRLWRLSVLFVKMTAHFSFLTSYITKKVCYTNIDKTMTRWVIWYISIIQSSFLRWSRHGLLNRLQTTTKSSLAFSYIREHRERQNYHKRKFQNIRNSMHENHTLICTIANWDHDQHTCFCTSFTYLNTFVLV